MDTTLQKRRAAALLLAGALLCSLSACGTGEVLPATTGSGALATRPEGTSAPTGVTESIPEANVTASEEETAASTQAPLPTAAPTAPSTAPSAPAEPTQCSHLYGQWVTVDSATCSADGVQNRVCSLCGETQQDVLPATGHSWDGGKTENSYGECGGTEILYTCLSCGATASEGTPASHSFGQWEYEAYTYTIYYEPDSLEYVHGGPSSTHESHRRIRTCEKCGFVEKDDTPDHTCKRGSVHHTVTTIREVTCSQKGIKRTTCNICGWYEDYEYGKLEQGHAWVSETRHLTDWTETTDNLDVEILTCTACGEVDYYYWPGDGPCICGQTPCVAADDWRDCESYCTQFLMYGKYRIAIDSRAYVFGYGRVFGDCYYVTTDKDNSHYNPDGFILHPTWQKVRRDYVFNEEGKIVQFTVLWHDEEGNLFSDVVVVPDLPQLFLEQGADPEFLNMAEPCFHLTPNKGELHPTSISGTG